MSRPSLHSLLEASAAQHPDRIAAVEPDVATISYGDLNRLAGKVSEILRRKGVVHGDRVGVQMRKSIAALASIFGVLKAGAAYVPVDATAPNARNLYIFKDCGVKLIISDSPAGRGLDVSGTAPESLAVADALLSGIYLVPGPGDETLDASACPAVPDELAYILYTSGSTGMPKGVMLTHGNALSFIDWASGEFRPHGNDIFSSHAPFYFDLSILDIYLSVKHGARLVLIAEDAGKQPKNLAALIASERVSIWYSTPSILRLLLDVRDIGCYDHAALRTVLFAGEVFPIKHLRALQRLWPHAKYFNLYGPTETNVCTSYELPPRIAAARTEPVPIGSVCSGDKAMLIDEEGRESSYGSAGELCVAGPSVTPGYWNLPEQNAAAFYVDADNVRWYRTGDVVRQDAAGNYVYVGRRDRMVKRRGYRVELGEIEAALYRHEAISEAAVIAVPDAQDELRVIAFISWSGNKPPSIIALKRFCMENLPACMIPDRFSLQTSLPRTATDKIHYRQLKELA